MDKNVYIHYGDDEFRTMNPIRNRTCFTKPAGGLWASKKNDVYGWKQWCENEDFRLDSFDRSFEFALKDGAKVLVLNNIDQLDDLPKINGTDRPYNKKDQWSECYLDFEKLSKDYDAIEIPDIWNGFYWPLYGWDCNCILIMNPDIVEVCHGKP